jgi:hypothetical protein
MPAAGFECDFCGCYCASPGKGWAAYHRHDPGWIDESRVAVFCPRCAAAEYGHRPDVGAEYVCIWEPQPRPSEPSEPSPRTRATGDR